METEIIDKLFLELSQVTKARSKSEMLLLAMVEKAFKAGCQVGHSTTFTAKKMQSEWEAFQKYHTIGFWDDP